MAIILGLIFAGIAIFIFLSLIITHIKKSNRKVNRRVVRDNHPSLGNLAKPDAEALFEVIEDEETINEENEEDDATVNIYEKHDINDDETPNNKSILMHDYEPESATSEIDYTFGEDVAILYVLSTKDNQFEGYELYQVLIDEGLEFGELDIFHYIEEDSNGVSKRIFSIAQATEPGCFDIDNFGANSYIGLCFMIDKTDNQNSEDDFKKMLQAAHDIAQDLGGILTDDQKQKLDNDRIEEYFEKIFNIEHSHSTVE